MLQRNTSTSSTSRTGSCRETCRRNECRRNECGRRTTLTCEPSTAGTMFSPTRRGRPMSNLCEQPAPLASWQPWRQRPAASCGRLFVMGHVHPLESPGCTSWHFPSCNLGILRLHSLRKRLSHGLLSFFLVLLFSFFFVFPDNVVDCRPLPLPPSPPPHRHIFRGRGHNASLRVRAQSVLSHTIQIKKKKKVSISLPI